MTDHTITTAVTFDDLASAYDDELDDLRDAYDDVTDLATDRFGDDALDRPVPSDADAAPDDLTELVVLQQQALAYNEAAKQIQQRQHVIGRLADAYGDAPFEIAMLTGAELMDIETELRMEANKRGVNVTALTALRQQLVVDAATVDAPDAVPRDDDDSPVPSECPNPLTLALYEQVETLNAAGDTGFTAPGFEPAGGLGPASGVSDAPMPAGEPSKPSSPTPATDDSMPAGDSS